jgi:DNA repair protein SbcC/Rad50
MPNSGNKVEAARGLDFQALAARYKAVTADRRLLAKRRQTVDMLRRQADALVDRIESLSRTAEDEARIAEAERASLSASSSETAAVDAKLDAIDEQNAQMVGELAPYLAAAGLGAGEVAQDAAKVQRHIEILASSYATLSAERDVLKAKLGDLTRSRDIALTSESAAAARRKTAEDAVAGRRRALDVLVRQRAPLLGGESTEISRARQLDAERSARETRELAQAARSDDDQHFAAEQAALAAIESQVATNARRLQENIEVWHSALAPTGLEEAAVLVLLDEPAGIATALSDRLAALERDVEDARSQRQLRREDLEAVLANGPEPDAEAVAALVAGVTQHAAELETFKVRATESRVVLARDTADRRRADAIAHEINAIRQDLSAWEAVNDAIGQRDGAKFRRFAQGITLGHLVQLANAQLANLKPRYGLASRQAELALDVVDHDMGDEVRSPRSSRPDRLAALLLCQCSRCVRMATQQRDHKYPSNQRMESSTLRRLVDRGRGRSRFRWPGSSGATSNRRHECAVIAVMIMRNSRRAPPLTCA